ncbi:hypothetical protein E7939_21815 [Salmonella enterica]|nr:hypothetical protein [Salmonella enterica]EAV6370509.1 hypothetical protein [Salmonella enterica]
MSDFNVNTKVTARKPHVCTVCGTEIEAKATYIKSVTFYDGSASAWKLHPLCDDAVRDAFAEDYDDGGLISPDSVIEWAEEFRGLYDSAAWVCERRNLGGVS